MSWSPRKLARKRRSAQTGFFETCQPTLAEAPPAAEGWIHEVKHDGWRLIGRHDAGTVRLWSRNGTEYTRHFSGVAESIANIGIDCVLDGEAVVFHQDGHSNFAALSDSEASSGAVLLAFDVLSVEGNDIRDLPLDRRRAILCEMLSVGGHWLLLSASIDGDAETIFRHACSMSLEGIVSKRLESRNRAGRGKDFVKVKNPDWVRR